MNLPFIAHELLLFAACFYTLLGIDDLLVDLCWMFKGHQRDKHFEENPTPFHKEKIAVFIAAWQESEVIGAMVSNTRRQWGNSNYCIFIGCYPNDIGTQAAIEPHIDSWVCKVVGPHDGPTSKADCLNQIWQAMLTHTDSSSFTTVLLHDAEDMVHPREIEVFSEFSKQYDFLQIPVVPLADKASPWVSGHYLDEFAEAHRKELPFRQCLGASLPSAGTGCAVSVKALKSIALRKDGNPFDAASLTEDYELWLSLWQAGYESRFLRLCDPSDGSLIAIRSQFPDNMRASIRQKTRWIMGIALTGWDRVGWHGGLAEHWMRWRDRRILLSSIVMVAGYSGALLSIAILANGEQLVINSMVIMLLQINMALLLWRWALRAIFTARQYGIGQGLMSIPRALMGNLIAICASASALFSYGRYLLTGHISWNKTSHRFPSHVAQAEE